MLTAISLYTGAGGLDLGFEAAGFRTVASVEIDANARQTIILNRPQWGLLAKGDIQHVSARELLRQAGLRTRELDVLLAGPPCQPFSQSAFWSKGKTERLKDPRASTLDALLDILEGTLPRAVVIENVKGLATQDDVVRKIDGRLSKLNKAHGTKYRVSMMCLNAQDYGVAQRRERTFIISLRSGDSFTGPPQTHAAIAESHNGLLPHRTCWDAIGDLSADTDEELRARGRWADLLPSIPEGCNYLHHTPRGEGKPLFGWRTRYWSFLLKLAKDQPSWTLQAEPGPATGPFHWANRQLSIRELCRLQSFPDSYAICGDYRSARRQVGNAVPPALAEAVAREVRIQIKGTTYTGAVSLAIKQRPNCPGPEPIADVPKKYRHLIGDHDEHPGPGLGPRAVLRGQVEEVLAAE